MIKGLAVLGMAAGLAVIAIPATAPDLLQRHPAPLAQPLPPAPLGITWSGFYIGGNLGAACLC
jgi:hypothetical protein